MILLGMMLVIVMASIATESAIVLVVATGFVYFVLLLAEKRR